MAVELGGCFERGTKSSVVQPLLCLSPQRSPDWVISQETASSFLGLAHLWNYLRRTPCSYLGDLMPDEVPGGQAQWAGPHRSLEVCVIEVNTERMGPCLVRSP